MQRNSNKARKQKEISILDSLDSLSLAPSNHGNNQHPSSPRRTSSSPAGATWSSIHRNSTPTYIRTTPPEVLIHIFSFLDPAGISSASLVCRDWYSVARDEYAWKTAFERFFGVHALIPRLSTSWSGEYIHRSHLLRKWELGRGPASFYESTLRPYPLTNLSALPPLQKHRQPLSRAVGQTFLLHGSMTGNFVTASDPTTGQVVREPFSHPGLTATIALHDNIIAFGGMDGRLTVVDVNNRRKVDGGFRAMVGRHLNGVTAIHIPSQPFETQVQHLSVDAPIVSRFTGLLSGCLDGYIRMHDIRTGEYIGGYAIPIATFPKVNGVVYLDYDNDTNMILAGTGSGEVWMRQPLYTPWKCVEGTAYDKTKWTKPQGRIRNFQQGTPWLTTDVRFLCDFKSDAIIVIRERLITRFTLSKPGRVEFSTPSTAEYTCVTIDPVTHNKSSARLFAVGDAYGNVYVFDARTPSAAQEQLAISPLYTITPVADVPITALAVNLLVVVTGARDGTAMAFSSLDGSLLRTLISPTSRRRRLRPPSPTDDPMQNPVVAISLTQNVKSEVRGVLAFQMGQIRYWNFAPDGVGIVLKTKKRRRPRTSAKEIKGFVDDEVERDVEEGIEDAGKRKRWEKMNGGIEEEDVAIQVAMMMSREEEERRQMTSLVEDDDEEEEEAEDVESLDTWQPGRKISFGSTSGSASPSVRGEVRLEDVATFRRVRMNEGREARRFEEDLDFAIHLSLAEQESREAIGGVED